MSTQVLTAVQLIGGNTAATTIATVTGINFNSDGSWDFQDQAGNVVVYNGDNGPANKLLELLFVGANGLPVGTKLFGNA